MKYVTLDLLEDFTCMAGECPSTCCAGWRIHVDAEAYARFEKIESEKLRKDIMDGILKEDDQLFFKNKKDGSCIMLDDDQLCRIQRNTDEKTLCNTCRKYPRLTNRMDGVLYLSMAASCPVVSHYLVNGETKWNSVSDDGICQILSVQDVPMLWNILEMNRTNEESAQKINKEKNSDSLRYQCFEKMSLSLLEVITKYHEGNYLLNYLEVFEQEIDEPECIEMFAKMRKNMGVDWLQIQRNYFEYRVFSYLIEYPEKEKEDILYQIYGELFLVHMFAFCKYVMLQSEIHKTDWEDIICKVYRFCAHGRKTSDAVHQIFLKFFSNSFLWNYMML